MNHRLNDWLASATLGLALSERGRIQDEISAHVSDAIAHQTAQRLSEPDAEARAIQDLGDPQVARAAFLRTCYTLSDEQRLEKLLGRSWWTLPLTVLFGCIFVAITVLTFSHVPITLNDGVGKSDPLFIPLMFSPLLLALIYYFEPKIKHWLFNRSSRYGVFAVQAFMGFAAIWLSGVIHNVFALIYSLIIGEFSFSIISWFVVLILTYRWIAQQAPLTLKTIRRTRA